MKFIDYLLHIYYSAFCILLHTYAAFWELHSISPIYLIVFIHCLEIAKEKQVIKKKIIWPENKFNKFNNTCLFPCPYPFVVICCCLFFSLFSLLSCPVLSWSVLFCLSFVCRFLCYFLPPSIRVFLSFFFALLWVLLYLSYLHQSINQSIDRGLEVMCSFHCSWKWKMGINGNQKTQHIK